MSAGRAAADPAGTGRPTANPSITIERTDPRLPEVRRLIEELDRLMDALYPAESNYLVDVEALAGPDAVFLAARVDGETLGCGAIMVRDAGYAEVKRIYVSPRARRHGLAKRLLADLESEARGRGLELLRLETGRRQPEALALFAAASFRPCGAFGGYPPDDPHSLFLEKRL